MSKIEACHINLLGTGEYKDKGSHFYGFAHKVSLEEEAKEIIDFYKKKYHHARHVCYAYRIGKDLWRVKDDGEPHGTAGNSILRVIDGYHREGALVVVVRFFGGVLLGTGGLSVAYKEAALDALKDVKE